jgi:hypothetical protein
MKDNILLATILLQWGFLVIVEIQEFWTLGQENHAQYLIYIQYMHDSVIWTKRLINQTFGSQFIGYGLFFIILL